MRFISAVRCLSVLGSLSLILTASAHAAGPITTCGQEVSGGGTLTGDLDCTGTDDDALLVHGGTIALNGFTITGGRGIFCDGPCKVIGPGTVTGSTGFGINGFGSSLKVTSVTLTNNAYDGIQCFSCKVDQTSIVGNGGGIRVGGKLSARDVTISGSAYLAIDAANNAGSASVKLRKVIITGNLAGVYAQKGAQIRDSVITGNGVYGVNTGDDGCEHKATASIKSSTVTGNDTDPACGTTKVCFDVGTCTVPPRLKASSCDHSYKNETGNPGVSWGGCALD
jgi:hypothetical protein